MLLRIFHEQISKYATNETVAYTLKWLSLFNLPISKLLVLRGRKLYYELSMDHLLPVAKLIYESTGSLPSELQSANLSLFHSVSVFHDIRMGSQLLYSEVPSLRTSVPRYEEITYNFQLPFPAEDKPTDLPIFKTNRSEEEALRQYILITVFYNDLFDRGYYKFADAMRRNCIRHNNKQGEMVFQNIDNVTKMVRNQFGLLKGTLVDNNPKRYEIYELLFKQLFSSTNLSVAKELLTNYHAIYNQGFIDFCLQRLDAHDGEAVHALSSLIQGNIEGIQALTILNNLGYKDEPLISVAFIHFHHPKIFPLIENLTTSKELAAARECLTKAMEIAQNQNQYGAHNLLETLLQFLTPKAYKTPDIQTGKTTSHTENAAELGSLAIWDVLNTVKQAAKNRLPLEKLSMELSNMQESIRCSQNLPEFILMELEKNSATNPHYAHFLAEACVQVCNILGDEKNRLTAMDAHNKTAKTLGQKPRYPDVSERLHKYWKSKNRPDMLAKVLDTQSIEFMENGELSKAKPLIEQSVSICRSLIENPEKLSNEVLFDGPKLLAHMLSNLGICTARLGEFQQAIKAIAESASLYEQHEEPDKAVRELVLLSECYNSIGDIAKVQSTMDNAHELSKEKGSPDSRILVHTKKGLLFSQSGNSRAALDEYEAAIDFTQTLIRQTAFEVDKLTILASRSHSFFWAIDTCLLIENNNRAVEIWEKFRCRAMLDTLSISSAVQPKMNREIGQRDLKQEASVLETLRGFTFPTDSTNRPFLLEQYQSEIEKLDDLSGCFEVADFDYAQIRRGKSISLSELEKLIVHERLETATVHYCLGHEKSVAWVSRCQPGVGQKCSVSTFVRSLPITLSEINDLAERYHERFPHLIEYSSKEWQTFSTQCVDPIIDLLEGVDLIYFVPSQGLYRLPIHACVVEQTPLIERFLVSYVPSISILRFCRKTRESANRMGGVACAPEFLEEENAISDIFRERPISFDELSDRSRFQDRLKGKRYVHLGCHGIADKDDSWNSRLIFKSASSAKQVVWTARDILDLDFSGMIVSLAACSSGVIEADISDGVSGVIRSLLFAGATSIIVSLWDVESSTTQSLMCRIYEKVMNREEGAVTISEAFCEAQREVLKDIGSNYNDMLRWAPYILIGDGI